MIGYPTAQRGDILASPSLQSVVRNLSVDVVGDFLDNANGDALDEVGIELRK